MRKPRAESGKGAHTKYQIVRNLNNGFAMDTIVHNGKVGIVNAGHTPCNPSPRDAYSFFASEFMDSLSEDERKDTLASGLKWRKITKKKFASGTELTADGKGYETLITALQNKTEFSKAEWIAFGIKDLQMTHVVKAGNSYYQPMEVKMHAECIAMWKNLEDRSKYETMASDDKAEKAAKSRTHVWFGHDVETTEVPTSEVTSIEVPQIPHKYGRYISKLIGGVSHTFRRVGMLSVSPQTGGPITVFAIRCESRLSICTLLHSSTVASVVGQPIEDEEYGFVTEVIIEDPTHVDHVCALIARSGATPILEQTELDAKRPIGVERLDRIDAEVVASKNAKVDDRYGLKRGSENWHFSWIAPDWKIPDTWDAMVENMKNVSNECVKHLPDPLRQHVAQVRLRSLSQTSDPEAYKELSEYSKGRRKVSQCLTFAQAKQLTTAFYIVYIERTTDIVVAEAAKAILFRYMLQRGYTARYVGKYDQLAHFVGNGKNLRSFEMLKRRYIQHKLPTSVLNHLCQQDGMLRGRGSKGSRSKYVEDDAERYLPKRRLSGKHRNEKLMMQDPLAEP